MRPQNPANGSGFVKGAVRTADYYINVFLDDEKPKNVEDVGLGDQVREIEGKKAIKVDVSKKEQKKLVKGFPELQFDASNAFVHPEDAESTRMSLITELKTVEVMKVAITRLYNPLAGKDLRARTG